MISVQYSLGLHVTHRDNCAIAIVNIIKVKFQTALVSEFILQPSTCLPHSMEDNGDN